MPHASRSSEVLSAAVVNFNGQPYLAQTLGALTAHAPRVADVLVIDVGSTDGSAELVERMFPSVRLVSLGTNEGPGAARNRALAEAKHDRILLLDNDVAVQRGCVERLQEALDAHPSATAAFATMCYAHAADTVQFVAGEPHFLGTMRLLGAEVPTSRLASEPFLVRTAPTSCFLLDRTRLSVSAGFDERLFFYLEDHEWCLRNVLEGRDLVAQPLARCLHGQGTIGVSIRESGGFTPLRVRQTILNRWQLVLKLYEVSTLVRFAPSLVLFEAVQLAGAVRKGWLGHWLWALSSLAASLPDLLRRRRHFQRLRMRRDLDVLEGGPFPYNPRMVSGRLEDLARRALDAVAAVNWRMAGRVG